MRRWHFHAQNLDRDGKGAMWRDGRCWLRFWRGGDPKKYRPLFEVNPSWAVLPKHLGAGIGLEVGGGDSSREVEFHVGTPLLWVWLTVDGLPRRVCERILPGRWHEWDDRLGHHRSKITDAQEVKLSWHSGALWWSLWHSTMEWSSSTPRWRNGAWHPLDTLLGRAKHSRRQVGEPRQAMIPMPEGQYEATFTFIEVEWRRPRWPRVTRRAYTDVSIPGGGIPFPGKGENSWDCGEDGLCGISAEGHSVPAGIAAAVKSVLADRERYGGRDWRPAVKATA